VDFTFSAKSGYSSTRTCEPAHWKLEEACTLSLHKGIESNKNINGIQGFNFNSSGQQHATALPTSNFNLAASNFF
jgi:hypothetical protein